MIFICRPIHFNLSETLPDGTLEVFGVFSKQLYTDTPLKTCLTHKHQQVELQLRNNNN